jgi:hypothetical protein
VEWGFQQNGNSVFSARTSNRSVSTLIADRGIFRVMELVPEVAKLKSHSLLAKGLLGIAVVAGIASVRPSPVSAEATLQTCGPPNIYGAALINPENRLGEFLVELQAPDYSDRNSVREHLIFSRIWSRILRSNLRAKTRDGCDAILDPSFFPSLWAFLTIGTPRDAVLDRTRCVGTLQEVLAHPEQDAAGIRRAAADEASEIQRWSEAKGNFIVEADNILKMSMRLIFDYGTTMEALASVGAVEFKEIDTTGFNQWLRKQSAAAKIVQIDFSACTGDRSLALGRTLDTVAGRFPNSGLREPGAISVRAGDHANGPLIYSAVIVGLQTPSSVIPGAAAVVQGDLLGTYCNHERTFRDVSSYEKVTVTVRCLRVVELTKPWVVFFCDPKDCTTKQSSSAVAAALARDQDIIALVQANTENSRPTGPYLINVE